MRIHRLHIEAIGPFPGSHDVNFDKLSAGGLFLLEGPTGAGKSTLIDAITYGLYGTLGKSEDTRLPSNHAPLVEPVIEVVFSTNAGIHRARRTPPYERPKKRGGGFTSQNATAKLWRLSSVDDDIGEPLASTALEVGTEMQRILGLTRDQFMQTVVLPQGRFSTFLRAKPDERAAVLRDVFGTAIYQQIQDQLADMARSAKRRVTAAEGELISAVRAFSRLLPDGDPAATELLEAGSALNANEMSRIVDEVFSGLQQECRLAAAALELAGAAEAAAREFLDAQRDLQRNLLRRASLLAEHAVLGGEQDSVAQDRDRLVTAQRAATVARPLRAHEATTTALEGARGAAADACAAVQETHDSDLAALADVAALRRVVEDITSQLGGLEEVVRLEATLAGRSHQLDADAAALARAVAALEEEREQLAVRPCQRERLSVGLDDLRRGATPVAVAEQVAEQRRAVRDAAQRAKACAKELAGAEASLSVAGLTAARATEQEGAIRLRWISSTAGTLAAGLEEGGPCPVCGGIEHPAPAPELPDHASIQDVEAATGVCQEAVAALQEAKAAHVRLAERLLAQLEAAGHTSQGDAEEALVSAQRGVVEARDAVRLIEAALRGIASFDEETDALRERIAVEGTESATGAERLRGERHLLAADEERCRAAAGESGSVADRVRQLDMRLDRTRLLIAAEQELHDAVHRSTEATDTLNDALHEAGFENADAARAAQLGESDSTSLQRRIHQHDADVTRVACGLAEEAVAGLTGAEEVDVGAATVAHALHHEALTASSEARGTTAAVLDRCERDRHALLKVLGQHHTLVQEAAPVLRMGELANAGEGNAKSTTLSTFVLLRRFEDVVAAANERLASISEGRFSLMRIDEREGRARRAGLGLTVRDHHTETNRDPHTLSGGETFYVSLCLALGLADVVTSEAGGITLDTLFIDEGFGSLDPETLDGVLAELSRLQEGGRAVGIVSHVAELKTRIRERVEITRRPGGGSTLTVCA